MTAAAGSAKIGPETVNAATAEDDERLRGLIRVELDRQHALPMARRTLELLAEAAAEPTGDELGYRIVDRNGEPRLQRDLDPDESHADVTAPMTLRDLVGELRERYPDLFRAPEPEPEPVPSAPPEPDYDALAEVRAAGARFVETQTSLAKSLVTSIAGSSTNRGRALAGVASERFETLRGRIGARLTRHAPAPVATTPPQPVSGADAAASDAPVERTAGTATDDQPGDPSPALLQGTSPAMAEPLRQTLHDGQRNSAHRFTALFQAGRDALSRFDPGAIDLSWLRRATVIGLGTACLFAIIAALVVVSRDKDGSTSAEPEPPRTAGPDTGSASKTESTKTESTAEPKPMPAPAPTPVPAQDEAKPGAAQVTPDDTEARPAEETPPAAPDPSVIVGVPQVLDTATLRIAGKVVHLFGVEWVRGGQAEELTKYLRGRSVSCRPAPGSSASLCRVDGRDLSEVVLFNGGGRASPEASPDLVAAEDHARSERLGVWKR